MSMLTADVIAIIRSAHLCFAATVTPDGRPNLSPKGTLRVWDEDHLYFLDIASPRTTANLEQNPYIEINCVDQLSRRGYRFSGRAEVCRPGSPIYAEAMERALAAGGSRYPVSSVVVITVERVDAIWSPGYMHIGKEEEMRRVWRDRRSSLDAEFDAHAADHPFSPGI